jgi:perosamine synthetase
MYHSEKFDAILINHLYGYIARDTMKLIEWCKENKVIVLEDASEAHGAENAYGVAGSFGEGSAFSCRSEKMIGVGEGGIVMTNNKIIHDNAYYWINDARPSNKVRYYTTGEGWNLFMPNALGAIGLAQVEQLPLILEKKRAIGEAYQKEFKKYSYLSPQRAKKGDKPVYWLNVALLDKDIPIIREDLLTMMEDSGIEMRPGFYPLNVLPSYRKYPTDKTPNAWYVGKHLIAFPSATEMDINQIPLVFQSLKELLA